jgi:hypothetical protein
MSRYQKIQASPTGRYVPPAGPNAQMPAIGGNPGGNGTIPTISDPNVAAKLPPGSLFKTPQGVIKKVPVSAIPSATPAPTG